MGDRIINVTRSTMPSFEEYTDQIKDIWDTHWLTNMGSKHHELEEALKSFLEVENISLMCNGHLALELGLQAMNLHGEVITTPFTFASTTHAIVRNGLRPVFCDINENNFTIDAEKIEDLITDETSAILPVHVYGNVCEIEKIQKLAIKYGLKVIYDAAHAFGVTYKGRGIGTFGNAAMFSFHATKVFNTIEGGAVCFSDNEYGLDLFRLKNFGIRGPEEVDFVGANAKMNEFQAAMGLCNLRHVEEAIEKRKRIVGTYRKNLASVDGIYIQKEQENVKSNYSYFPIVIDEKTYGLSRNELFTVLEKSGINARKYFYPLTNRFRCYETLYEKYPTPVALRIANRILTLPLYSDLALEDVEYICKVIQEVQR